MKIIEANREIIFLILSSIYKHKNFNPLVAEIGVLKGNNAINLYNTFLPQKMFLVDSWSVDDSINDYRNVNKHRDWVDDPKKYEFYYGGSADDQSTFDNIFEEAKAKFSDKKNVEIIRANSLDGYKILKNQNFDNFDYIYVDASHQYEKVLDDLIFYKDLLKKETGCFQLNDCCHSDLGVKQNLGVLEAANKFCKIANFVPVIAVNRNFTDVLLAPKNSQMIEDINFIVENNDIISVEVPNELFPNLSVKVGKRPQICFA